MSEFYRFLNMRYSLFFLFMGMTVGIEPATSVLLTISRPADDAIVRKYVDFKIKCCTDALTLGVWSTFCTPSNGVLAA